jgi:DNA-binding MarR family transcriptional regulator
MSLSETSPPVASDAARAMDALRRIVGSLRSASRSSAREIGVTGAQLFVLHQLDLEPQQSINALAERTHTRQNSVSDVIARLAARGLVSKKVAASDARRAVVSLTAAGRAIVRRAPSTVQTSLIDALGRLTGSERRKLADGLESWVVAAGLDMVSPTMFFERATPKRAAKSSARGDAKSHE